MLSFAKENNIGVVPTITNDCEKEEAEEVLKNPEKTDKNIKNILDLVEKNNYDGISITYECLEDKSLREPYSAFLKKLSNGLHSKNKTLTSAVHAKSSDEGTWEAPYIQDWKSIGQSCDKVKLMTYDNHWSTSEAGEIAPTEWIKETFAYAKTVIDPSKIYMGLHFYGYDWVGENAKDLTFRDVSNLIERYKPQIQKSPTGEKFFTYSKGRETHTVYFADADVVQLRLTLVSEYGISGISIWRLGQEDKNIWKVIEETLK